MEKHNHLYVVITIHIFQQCEIIQNVWKELRRFYWEHLHIPPLTPQSVILGFLDEDTVDNFIIINHLLLIFKSCTYKGREKEQIKLPIVINQIQKIRSIEKNCMKLIRSKLKGFIKTGLNVILHYNEIKYNWNKFSS